MQFSLSNKVTRAFLILCGISVIIFFWGLSHRPAHVDDAWIGEYSYWLNKLGYVRSDLMRGINHQEEYVIVSHKLLVAFGAAFINLLGFSIVSLKAVSLCFLVLFLLFFIGVYYRNNQYFEKKHLLIFLILFVPSALIQEYSFVFRPEIPLMFFGFVSYYFLIRAIRNDKHAASFVSGFVGGLAVSTHLNGGIYLLAGFFTLVIMKRFNKVPLFVIAGILGSLFYFWDFKNGHGWSLWQEQIFESPFLDRDGSPLWLQLLKNFAQEHKRIFHSPREITLSVLVLFTLTLTFKHLKKRLLPLLLYTGCLVVSLALISAHRTPKYAIVYFPYVFILLSYAIAEIMEKSKEIANGVVKSQVMIAFMFVYLLTQGVYSFNLAMRKERLNKDHRTLAQGYFPDKKKVVADMLFIFDEIDNYEIQSCMTYLGFRKNDTTLTGPKFLQKAKEFGREAILLNTHYRRELKMEDYKVNGFRVILSDSTWMILVEQDKK